MPYEDKERAKKFYQSVFGWQMQEQAPEMGGYVVALTTELGENGRPKLPGAINGGMYKRTDDPASQYLSFVIAVDDIDEAAKKIQAAGGTIMRGPEEIPGVGMWISFHDSEGNRVSVLKPQGM